MPITFVSSMVCVDGLSDSGVATGGGSNYLDDTGKAWALDIHNGKCIWIYGGTGIGQVRFISDTTATRITILDLWVVQPDATSQYCIIYVGDDIWNADKSGTLQLRVPTATPYNGGLTTQVRLADSLALKIDFVVTNYIAPAGTIIVTGTDKDGGAQNETINVTGNATYTTTKWYATITNVTATGGGSFTFETIQNQWGVTWVTRNEDSALRYANHYRLTVPLIIGLGTNFTWFGGLRESWYIYDYYKAQNNAWLQWGMLQSADSFLTPNRGCYVYVDRATNPDGFTNCYHCENGGHEYLYDSHIFADKQWDTQAGADYKQIYSTVNGELRTDTSYYRHWGVSEFNHTRVHHQRNLNFPYPPIVGSYGLMSYAMQNDIQCRDKTSWAGPLMLHSSGAYDVKTLSNGKLHVFDSTINYTKCQVMGGTYLFFHSSLKIIIVDEDNNAIQSAVVSLLDTNGKQRLQDHLGETLTNAVIAGTTAWVVSSTANWTDGDYLALDNEVVVIVSIDSATQLTVTRAQYYTVAESHVATSTIGTFKTLITDADGKIESGDDNYLDAINMRQSNGSGQPPTWRTFSPFTLMIEKDGYLTYTVKHDITEKSHWYIKLFHSPYEKYLGLE